MNYWLVKTEPDTYSWADFLAEKKTVWNGVHNFQARNNLKAMKAGDKVFFYHTGEEKSIMGLAKVSHEAYPDPREPEWLVVELSAEKKLKNPVNLALIKAEKRLKDMTLARVPRLSVQPVTKEEFEHILTMSEK